LSKKILYEYAWGNNEKRKTFKGRVCFIHAEGALNSVLIEFIDNGEKTVTSRRALRR
jgi:hypothetical protein